MTSSNTLPTISVVIPMKNEEDAIGKCLQSVLDQDYPPELVDIVVVDGGSTDNSLEIVRNFADKYPNVTLLGGPGVNCPAGMNVGISNSTGDLVAKIDAHGYVDSSFLKHAANSMARDPGIKCVGGPIIPVSHNLIAKANALARSSVFGVGRGVYSSGHDAQYVDTVQCGIYDRKVFEEIGLFDESLQFGEDEEINWRIRKNGHRIFSSPEIKFFYFPRDTMRKLFRQYYNYGKLRFRVIQKHPDFFRPKHVIPTVFVVSLIGSGLLALTSALFLNLFLFLVVTYILSCLVVSALKGFRAGWKYVFVLPLSFISLHFGYGFGFAAALLRHVIHSRESKP